MNVESVFSLSLVCLFIKLVEIPATKRCAAALRLHRDREVWGGGLGGLVFPPLTCLRI